MGVLGLNTHTHQTENVQVLKSTTGCEEDFFTYLH